MNTRPGSWTGGLVTVALAVLVACAALKLAADLLLAALPVLVPAVGCVLLGLLGWRAYSRRSNW